jgi:hypothetical protein
MKNEQNDNIDWQSLSKNERRALKKKQKQLKKAKEEKKKQFIKWGSILGTIVLVVATFFLFKNKETKTSETSPKIEVTSATYNFGRISASQGVVETSFEVKNIGKSKLTISGMESSCGCTTAKLKTKDGDTDIESPTFGMHNNPTDWSTSLEPSATAELTVFYDPNFHKNAFGPVTRTVSIFSDDPRKSEKKVTINANVKK